MTLKDLLFVSLSKCVIGVDGGKYNPEEEFDSGNKAKVKEYENYIVTSVWCLDENLMAVTIIKGE